MLTSFQVKASHGCNLLSGKQVKLNWLNIFNVTLKGKIGSYRTSYLACSYFTGGAGYIIVSNTVPKGHAHFSGILRGRTRFKKLSQRSYLKVTGIKYDSPQASSYKLSKSRDTLVRRSEQGRVETVKIQGFCKDRDTKVLHIQIVESNGAVSY